MRLLILSDTHGNYPLAVRAVEEAGQIDQIVHLGDEIDDARMIETIIGRPLIKVPGNCDLEATESRSILLTCDDSSIFITHGDRYQVKAGLAQLHRQAVAEQARVVLYGHTHIAAIEEIDGILFVNPGCLAVKCPNPSYAVITISVGKVSAELFLVEHRSET